MILVRWVVVHDLPARMREGGDGVAVVFWFLYCLVTHRKHSRPDEWNLSIDEAQLLKPIK